MPRFCVRSRSVVLLGCPKGFLQLRWLTTRQSLRAVSCSAPGVCLLSSPLSDSVGLLPRPLSMEETPTPPGLPSEGEKILLWAILDWEKLGVLPA